MPLPEDYVDGDVLSASDVNAITSAVNAIDPTDFIAKALIDAKGDLIAGTAADTAGRLAVGANGTVLTADSGETTGLKWAAGGSPTGMAVVAGQSFSAVTSVVLDSVFNSTYENYMLFMDARRDAVGNASLEIRLRTGGVASTTGYQRQSLVAQSSTVVGGLTDSTFLSLNVHAEISGFFQMAVVRPALAAFTDFSVQQADHASGSVGTRLGLFHGLHRVSTAYDGIQFVFSQNVSGKIYVFGLVE
jgi:hypothetical protein